MRHIVDIETWGSAGQLQFLPGFVNSWYSITTEIDCTEASAAARASDHSFFLYYLYAVVRSANESSGTPLSYRQERTSYFS